MHKRCCWPPERLKPLAFSLSLTSLHSAARLQRRFDPRVHFRLRQLFIKADAKGDVVIDRHRKRRRLLEHHADPRTQKIEVEVGREDVLPIEHHLALGPLAGIKVVHAVQNPQKRRLAAARRADERRHLTREQIQVHALERVRLPIIKIEVADEDLVLVRTRRLGGFLRGDLVSHGGNLFNHFCCAVAVRARAAMLSARTASVMISAPVQANCCQSA